MNQANDNLLKFIKTLSTDDIEYIDEDILYNTKVVVEGLKEVTFLYCHQCNHITMMYDYDIFKNVTGGCCSFCGASNDKEKGWIFLDEVGKVKLSLNELIPTEQFKKTLTYFDLANKANGSMEDEYKSISQLIKEE